MNQQRHHDQQRRRVSPRARSSIHKDAFACGIAVLALGVAVGACSETGTPPDTTSTFQGSLSLDTFPTRPDIVQTTNELGAVTQVAVGPRGDFRIYLSRDHSYTLAVRSGADGVKVVFPRATGQLTSRFDVASGAAFVSLGAVRYLAAAPAAGFQLKGAHAVSGQVADRADGEVGECVNGMIQGTGAVCVDDDGNVACEGAESDGESECEDGKDTAGASCIDAPEGSDGDGECEDGKDASTGLACSDAQEASDGDGECEDGKDTTGQPCTDTEDLVDPTRPMAVAEHNIPDQVGGCDEGGGEESDD